MTTSSLLFAFTFASAITFIFLFLRSRNRLNEKDMVLAATTERANLFGEQFKLKQEECVAISRERQATHERVLVLSEDLARVRTVSDSLELAINKLRSENNELSTEKRKTSEELQFCKQKMATLEAVRQASNLAKTELERKHSETLAEYERKIELLRREKNETERVLTALSEKEPTRIEAHADALSKVTHAYAVFETERAKEREEKIQKEAVKVKELKETWVRHEAEVDRTFQSLCKDLGIESVHKEKFPFSGSKPDNCAKICGEYVVFDAKSPEGEELENFPKYIRAQAEQAKKYSKFETVKKDIYLVVPTNSIGCIRETRLQFGTHRVHVVTLDSLETILVHLKKIEDYEYAEQMSPDDRENLEKVVGTYVHHIKRSVQINAHMAKEGISALIEGERLPTEIVEGVRKVENASRLAVPTPRRGQRIEVAALKKENEKLLHRVVGNQIQVALGLELISDVSSENVQEYVGDSSNN